MNRLSYVALALVAGIVPATAADTWMAPAAPALDPIYVAPAASWTGFYASVFAGAAFNPAAPGTLEFDQELDGTFSAPIAPLAAAFGPNFTGSRDGGFVGGIGIGYDLQIDQFVVGGVIDIARVDYADRQEAFSDTPASYSEVRSVDWLGTIRARAGLLATDSILAYVHGGVAGANVNYSFNSTNPNGVSRGGLTSAVGYTVGAGVEAAVTQNVSLGVEYAYTNLGSNDFTTRFDNGPFAVVNPDGTDLRGTDRTFDFHTVTGTLKFRF